MFEGWTTFELFFPPNTLEEEQNILVSAPLNLLAIHKPVLVLATLGGLLAGVPSLHSYR